MNPIDALFQDLGRRGQKAFIPFITAGDPNLNITDAALHELAARGASLIEVGFPYSDPIADGAVIQASYTRALDNGLKIAQIFGWSKQLTRSQEWGRRGVPLVGMVSYSLVYHAGPEMFLSSAQDAGFSGAIVPDLPVEESATLSRLAMERDFKLIQLVTPTTPQERAARIAKLSAGFLYCVSVMGITGERDRLPPELLDQLRWLRGQTTLPLCAGFGISKPDHVKMLREAVDGIIVGSALVRRLEHANKRPVSEVIEEIGSLAQSLVEALNHT